MIEVKCPINPLNHFKNIMYAEQYEKLYKWQIQGYLWITGRHWCDFVSFDPRLLQGENWALCCHVVRIERNEAEILEIERKINGAAEYLENIIKAV